MEKYDFVIVGAGLFGATFARQVTDAGRRCLVIDRRNHIAGNCYTEEIEGIQVHRYGPHIFHTDSRKIWDYVHRFAEFNHFTYRPRVDYKGRLYSFPINLLTLHQLWGVRTPTEAEARLQEVRVRDVDKTNFKGWLLSQVGEEIYRTFYEGYTRKQWGRDPEELPASIAARIPIRLTFDDNYYTDRFQGIPIGGYTKIVENMLNGIEVQLGCDYFEDRALFNRIGAQQVYSGPIDRFFEFKHGYLEYRSLRFETEVLSDTFQGVAGVNYTDVDVPYTRIVEHKHFEFLESSKTVITREYPVRSAPDAEPFYPVNDTLNASIYRKYQEMIEESGVLFGGRLGTYKYYDMHHVVGQALAVAERCLSDKG
jgi:UDP-galactopyranose mutase